MESSKRWEAHRLFYQNEWNGYENILKSKKTTSIGRYKMCPLRRFYERNFSKVKIYDRTLWKSYAATVAFLSSIITLISFFNTAEESCIGISGWITIYIIMLVGSFIYIWYKANALNEAYLSINNTKVEVVIGDIFDQFSNPDQHDGEITVIAVNDYYDYIVDDRIVSNKSLHGQYIKKIIAAGKIDDLNKKIENDPVLKRMGNPKEPTQGKALALRLCL